MASWKVNFHVKENVFILHEAQLHSVCLWGVEWYLPVSLKFMLPSLVTNWSHEMYQGCINAVSNMLDTKSASGNVVLATPQYHLFLLVKMSRPWLKNQKKFFPTSIWHFSYFICEILLINVKKIIRKCSFLHLITKRTF